MSLRHVAKRTIVFQYYICVICDPWIQIYRVFSCFAMLSDRRIIDICWLIPRYYHAIFISDGNYNFCRWSESHVYLRILASTFWLRRVYPYISYINSSLFVSSLLLRLSLCLTKHPSDPLYHLSLVINIRYIYSSQPLIASYIALLTNMSTLAILFIFYLIISCANTVPAPNGTGTSMFLENSEKLIS